MRWLALYARSRRVPLAVTVAAVTVAGAWAMWAAFSDKPTVNTRMISLTVVLVVAAAGPTLSGADDALDRTGSVRWPVRRAVHLLAVAVAVVGWLLLTTVTDDARFALDVGARNTVGLFGLTALGAALFGAARSWVAPLTWTLVAILPMMDDTSPKTTMQVASWPIQPAGSDAATVCAAVLGVAGLVAYAVRGCPIRPATETAADR